MTTGKQLEKMGFDAETIKSIDNKNNTEYSVEFLKNKLNVDVGKLNEFIAENIDIVVTGDLNAELLWKDDTTINGIDEFFDGMEYQSPENLVFEYYRCTQCGEEFSCSEYSSIDVLKHILKEHITDIQIEDEDEDDEE